MTESKKKPKRISAYVRCDVSSTLKDGVHKHYETSLTGT